MIEVYETKKIPENCSTCLYGGGLGVEIQIGKKIGSVTCG